MARAFGCAAVLAGALASWGAYSGETRFTIAVLPDTQQEVLSSTDTRFRNRMEWLVNNRSALNLKFVLQCGDLVNWGVVDPAQFDRASSGVAVLDNAGIPYAMALGNHDTAAVKEGGSAAPGNVNANLRNTTTYNAYFPLTRFKALGGVYETGKIDNAWHTFSAGGLDWLVLNLELWARTGPINWAKTVLQAHPYHNVIVVTHSFLTSSGTIEQTNGGYGDNSPQYIFDNLLKQYANVRLIFCGHVGTHAHRVDTGVHGNKIYSFLQCYHDNTTNPVRLIEIDTSAGTIKSRVYCPSIGQDKPDGSTFTITGVSWVRPASGSVPAAPAGLSARAVSTSRIDLSWRDESSDEAGFRIERRTSSGAWAEVASVGANATSYQDVGLSANTTYLYRVRAYNSAGSSAYSNEASAKTLDPNANSPWAGAVHTIPGRIEAEDYDSGGEGVSYHDTTDGNSGGAYRSDDVDIQPCSEGGYNIGWIAAGEWLEYTVEVARSSAYDLRLRVASEAAGGRLRLLCDGADLTGELAFGATGAWQSWMTITATGLALAGGRHVLRLVFESGGFNVNWLEFSASCADADSDGLPDWWEVEYFGGVSVYGADADPDSDGLTNLEEYLRGTNPASDDSDGDGMPDGFEIEHGLNPLDGDQDRNGFPDGQDDWDSDGIANSLDPTPGAPPGEFGFSCAAATGAGAWAVLLAVLGAALCASRRHIATSYQRKYL